MNYKTWKENYENEFAEHREKNTRIVYSYEREYKHYLNSPEWNMYGDSCYFIRAGTENKGKEITAKYEQILANDNEIFRGFLKDEFKRLHPICEIEERLNKVFDYRNMSLTPANFTEEQARIFAEEIENYKEENKENIALWERYEQLKEEF